MGAQYVPGSNFRPEGLSLMQLLDCKNYPTPAMVSHFCRTIQFVIILHNGWGLSG